MSQDSTVEPSDPAISWETLKEEGNAAFKANQLLDAIDLYSKAIEANPEEAVLYSNRSAAHLKRSSFKEAADDAKRAIEIDKTFAKAYSRLHSALCNLGQLDKATEVAKQGQESLANAPSASPTDASHLKDLGQKSTEASKAVAAARGLLDENRNADVVRLLAGSYRNFPESPAIAFPYAEALATSSPDEANKILMPFGHNYSNDTTYLYLRALVLYHRGMDSFKTAQAILRQTLEFDPDNTNSRLLFKKIRNIEAKKESGNSAFKEKKATEAVQAYTEGIELDPTNVRVVATLRGNRAAAKMTLKDYKGALMDCDYAIGNGADSSKMYARRSRIHEYLEEWDDALRDMQQAVEGDNQFAQELQALKQRAKRSQRKNYYKTLGLPQNESDDNAIKRAYKKSCLQWHPDKWAHASEEEKVYAEKQFKEIGEAFGVLSDPQKKQRYDSGMMDNDVEGASPAGFGGAPGNEEFANMMQFMFAGGGGEFSFGGNPRGMHSGRPGGRRGRPQGFYQF